MQLINNKYRVVRTFNKGKEGESYVVENIKNPSSRLFLKILNLHDHRRIIEDLIQNIQSYRNYFHGNLLASYNIELITNINLKENNKPLYCVTSEYITWDRIEDYINNKDNPPPVESLYKIIDVIDYLHFRGIIYKVLNPSNIFYQDGEIKLMNLTSSMEEYFRLSINSKYHQFLPPEVLLNEKNIDHKADIYSIGMLIKSWPFDFNTLGKDSEIKVKDMVTICTSKDPIKRQLDIRSIINKLEEITGVKHSRDLKRERESIYFRVRLIGRDDVLEKVENLEKSIEQRYSIDNKLLISGGNGTGKKRLLEEILFLSEMRGNKYSNLELTSSDTWNLLSLASFISNAFALNNIECNSDVESPNLLRVYGRDKISTHDLSKIDDRYEVLNLLIDELINLSLNRFIYLGVSGLENGNHEFLSMLDYISTRLRSKKVVFVFTLNEATMADSLSMGIINEWKLKGKDSYLVINNLNYENTSVLVKEVLGIGYVPLNFAKVLYQETKGNPRYLEMIIKHLFDKGDLYINDDEGHWGVADRDYSALDYPKNYSDTIINHIIGYSPEEILVLKFISAFDSPTPVKYLIKHLNLTINDLNYCIDKFVERRVLNFRSAEIESVFFVEQDLKGYIYDNLIEDKLSYHGMIVQYICNDKENFQPYNFEELIYQLKKAGEVETCLEIIEEKIASQENKYSDTVIALLENALGAVNGQNPDKELDILFQLADKTLIKGDLKSLTSYLERLDKLSLELGRLDIYLYSQIYKADIYTRKNEMNSAMEVLSGVEEELPMITDPRIRIFAQMVKSRALISAGDLERLQVEVKKGIEISLDEGINDFLGDLYNIRGISEAMFGNYKVALDFYNLSIDAFRKSDREFEMVKPTNNIGNLYNEIYGRPKTALDYYYRSYEISEKYGLTSMQATFLNNIGEVYFTLQDYESAKEYLLKATELGKVTGDKRLSFLSTVNLGMVYLKTEKLKEAIEIYLLIREKNKNEPILDKEINIHYTNFLGEYYLSIGDNISSKMFSTVSMERSREMSIKNYLTNKSRLFYLDSFENEYLDMDVYYELLNEFKAKGGDYQKTHFVLLSTTLAMRLGNYDAAKEIIGEISNINSQEALKLFMDDYEIIKRLLSRNKSHSKQALNILLDGNYKLKRLKPDYLNFIAESLNSFGSHGDAVGVYLMMLDYGYTLLSGLTDLEEKAKVLSRIRIIETVEKLNKTLEKIGIDIPDSLKNEDTNDGWIISSYLSLIKDDSRIKLLNSQKRLPDINITADLISEHTDNYEDNIRLTQEHLMDLTLAKRSLVRLFSSGKEGEDLNLKIGEFPNDFQVSKVIEAEIANNDYFFHVRREGNKDFNSFDGFADVDTIGIIAIPLMYKGIDRSNIMKDRRKHTSQRSKIKGYLYLDTNSYINRFNDETVDKIIKLISIILINVEGMKLHKTSSIDTTTGLLMRDVIEERFVELLQDYSNTNYEFSVLMMDIDRFKNINDTYGHIVGDSVLTAIGKTIRESVRDTDYIGRYGGEEFIAILVDISPDDAYEVAQKIRNRVSEISHPMIKDRITISIGISNFPHHSIEKEELIEKADQALYYAKEVLGRNKVIAWNQGMSRIQDLDDQLIDINLDSIIKDTKRLSSLIEVATIIRKEQSFESKVDFFLNKVIEGVSGYNTILSLLGNEGESRQYVKAIVHLEGSRKLIINQEDIEFILGTKRGRYFIDWTTDKTSGGSFKHKDFDSILIAPLMKNGKVFGLLKVSVPLLVKEFTKRDLNYVEVLSSVFSGNLV